MPKPPQLTPLDVEEQRLYSDLLPGDRASHPISKGSPSHPAEKAHFGRLYSGSCPFGHDPKLMTIGESRGEDHYSNRCLVVYPWTQRYFGKFGNLYNAATIQGNPMVAAHGKTVLHGLDRAVKNMDDIKGTYTELNVLHTEKLHVDPDNFKVNCWLTVVVAARMGSDFTADVQAAFQKFLAVVVSSLGRQYH
uniref:Globin domain-containing protein n=1 Tax=Esox lucius TaxID=8010 RepID=A0A3P8Z497_ESOLU